MPPLDVPVRISSFEAKGTAEKIERGANVAVEEIGDDLGRSGCGRASSRCHAKGAIKR